jgi:elongation factor Ts
MADSGKPPEVIEKIVAGKLAKHLADLCLLEMPFVKDPKIKVGDLVKKVGKDAGVDVSVARFKRMQIGK